MAEHFAEQGWHVVLHANTRLAEAQALADTLPSAEAVAFDLADRGAIANAAQNLAARCPGWQALVCSASVFLPDDALGLSPEAFERSMAVNTAGNLTLIEAFLAATPCPPQGRRIVLLLDQKLANLNPDFFSYTQSKAALAAAGQMLAMALPAPDRICAISPGLTLPSHDQTEAEFAQSGRMNLLGRLNSATEIAEAAYFLVTGPAASGTTLHVDSGQHLLRQPRDVMYAIRS